MTALIPTPARVVNVQSYGAVDDGVTDNSAAITAAIAAAQAIGAGTILYFPKVASGVYGITLRQNVISGAPLVLQGDGRGISVLQQIGTGQCLRLGVDGCVLAGMTIDTQTHHADTTCSITSNYNIVENVGILGYHTFGIRFLNPTSQTDRQLASQVPMVGNQIDDLVVNHQGTNGNVGLDIDFQYGLRARRLNVVNSVGSAMTIYVSQNIELQQVRIDGGFTITPQSDEISLVHLAMVSGTIRLDNANPFPGRVSSRILLANVFPVAGAAAPNVTLCDVFGVTLLDAAVGTLRLQPDQFCGNVVAQGSTTVQSVSRAGSGVGSVTCGISVPGLTIAPCATPGGTIPPQASAYRPQVTVPLPGY